MFLFIVFRGLDYKQTLLFKYVNEALNLAHKTGRAINPLQPNSYHQV
jgi:hypothetical protein